MSLRLKLKGGADERNSKQQSFNRMRETRQTRRAKDTKIIELKEKTQKKLEECKTFTTQALLTIYILYS